MRQVYSLYCKLYVRVAGFVSHNNAKFINTACLISHSNVNLVYITSLISCNNRYFLYAEGLVSDNVKIMYVAGLVPRNNLNFMYTSGFVSHDYVSFMCVTGLLPSGGVTQLVPPPVMPQPTIMPWDVAQRLPLPPGERLLTEEEFYREQEKLRLKIMGYTFKNYHLLKSKFSRTVLYNPIENVSVSCIFN